MPDPWVEARNIARRTSSSGVEDTYFDHNSYVNRYNERVSEHLKQMPIDRRTKVNGPDCSFYGWQIYASPNDSWAELLWAFDVDVSIWEDLLRPIGANGSAVEPLEILTHIVIPSAIHMEGLAGSDRKYTLLNTQDLYHLEEFLFKHPDSAPLLPVDYSVIDLQDISKGLANESFDLVKIWSWLVVRPNNSMLRKFMDAVRVGGILVINDASNSNQMYDDSARVHYSPFYTMSKFVSTDPRFKTYHIPNNLGTIVARRIG